MRHNQRETNASFVTCAGCSSSSVHSSVSLSPSSLGAAPKPNPVSCVNTWPRLRDCREPKTVAHPPRRNHRSVPLFSPCFAHTTLGACGLLACPSHRKWYRACQEGARRTTLALRRDAASWIRASTHSACHPDVRCTRVVPSGIMRVAPISPPVGCSLAACWPYGMASG